MAKVYQWTITISGVGRTPEEAWADAEENLMVDGLGSMDVEPDDVFDDEEGEEDETEKEDGCED